VSSIEECAQAYLSRGWCVIPAEPAIVGRVDTGQKPLVNWREFITHRPTSEEVHKWWTQWPDANIALVTGKISGIVVVDVDVKKGADPAKVYEQYPTGLASRTGGGGAHLFYAYPAGVDRVPNRVGKDGIDVRADGGYVIAPPSTHFSGRSYEFVREGEPAAAPEWLLIAPTTGIEQRSAGEEKWVSDLLGGTKEGERNNAAARLAGYFAAKGMAFEIAETLLEQWNGRNKPPLPRHELKTTLSSVYQTAARSGKLDAARKATKAGVREVADFETMPFSLYMSRFGNVAVKWQIEGWLPEQTIAFVISPPGIFKTWMALDLAISVAAGRPFLGHFEVKDPGPVMLIQQEDYHGQVAERLAAIVAARFGLEFPGGHTGSENEFEITLPPDLPIHIHTERRLRFADNTVLAALRAKIDKVKARLVIVDPLYSAADTTDFMAKTAEQMFVLKRIRDDTGCSFTVVHHTGKQKKDDSDREAPQREKLWGSQFLNAFLETGWQLRPTDQKNAAIVKRHFKVKGDAPLLRVTYDIETEKRPFRYLIQHEEVEENESKMDLVTVLEKLGPSTAQRVAEAVHKHRSSVSRRLNRLIEEGMVRKDDQGLFTAVVLPEF